MHDGKLIRPDPSGLPRREAGPYWLQPDAAPWEQFAPEEEGPHLWDYILRVWRRRWLVALVCLVCLGLSFHKAVNKPVRYAASAKVEIYPDEMYQNGSGAAPLREPDIETEIEKIKSKDMLERVVLNLRLTDPRDVASSTSSELDPNAFAEPDPLTLKVEWLRKALDIRQIGETNIIVIQFVGSDPIFAKNIVEAVVEEYDAWSYEQRVGQFSRRRTKLEVALVKVRESRTAALKELVDFEKSKGVDLELGGPDRTEELQAKLVERDQANREVFERNLDLEMKVALPPTSFTVTSAKIESLQSEIDALERQVVSKRALGRGERHPEIMGPLKVLETLEAELSTEKEDEWKRVQNEYKGEVTKAELAVDRAVKKARRIQDEFETLLKRQRDYLGWQAEYREKREKVRWTDDESDRIVAELKELDPPPRSTVGIVEHPNLPLPEKPSMVRGVIFGAFLGMFFGIGFALFLDYMDTKVKGPQEVELALQLPMLALIPRFKNGAKGRNGRKQVRLIAHQQPQSHYAESFRYLRTSVQYSRPERAPKTILVTSAMEGEGKTTVACNLAIAYAQKGKSVLLVDADVSKPSVHKVFEVERREGLTEILTGKLDETIGCNPSDPFRRTEVKNLVLLPSGSRVPNPIDLLDSDVMRDLLALLAEEYDIVILDSAPLLARADTSVLVPQVDGVIMVARSGVTPKAALRRAKERVYRMQGRILGLVINNPKKELTRSDYDYAYGYRGGYGKARKAGKEPEDLAEAVSSALHLPSPGSGETEQSRRR